MPPRPSSRTSAKCCNCVPASPSAIEPASLVDEPLTRMVSSSARRLFSPSPMAREYPFFLAGRRGLGGVAPVGHSLGGPVRGRARDVYQKLVGGGRVGAGSTFMMV